MKTMKSGRRFCAFASALSVLCVTFIFIACTNWMESEAPKLILVEPTLLVVTEGYISGAQTITIQNKGKKSAIIEDVTVDDITKFEIANKGSIMVTAGGSVTNWTVKPAEELAAGTYKAAIVVTYKGTDADAPTSKTGAPITFTVKPKP